MMTIPQQHNVLVWEMTQESLKRRMATGETIVFEATLPTAQDIKSIMTLARHHDYAVMIVDFYNTRPHQVLAANQERPERSRVGEHSIMRVYQEGWNTDLPTHIPVAYVNDIHDTISAQVEIMQFLMRDTKPRSSPATAASFTSVIFKAPFTLCSIPPRRWPMASKTMSSTSSAATSSIAASRMIS